jgi:hypothetical protein
VEKLCVSAWGWNRGDVASPEARKMR